MNIYFSGIGGVGLGPLAEIAHDAGYTVVGSDKETSSTYRALEQKGMKLSLDQSGEYLKKIHSTQPVDWLVYSAALPSNHPELLLAKAWGIKTTKRDALLKTIIAKKGQKLIAVAGTHGKTTTTAMVVWLFKQLGVPISYLVGTSLSWAPSGVYDPNSSYFIYECDEYDRNFLNFWPFLSLITSISYDHADIFPNRENYVQAFDEFRAQSQQVITWEEINPALVHLTGQHNRSNGALAAAGVHALTNQPEDTLISSLEAFPGTSRRFEKLADNLYTDYAHHPEEIAATLQLATEISKKIVVVYQPHQNTRQHHVDYTDCFDKTTKVYWLPTYLSKEDSSLPILTPYQLAKNIDTSKVIYSELNQTLWQHIAEEKAAGRLVILMGAGSIDAWARQQLQK